MHKALRVFCAAFAILLLPLPGKAITTNAKGTVLIEAGTGRILYSQNADARLAPASTTKIMTAVLAIENCALNETVTVSENASGVEGSSIWLGVGEHMTLSDMLYGLMLSSGNDAAVAIAEHVSGNVSDFVALMNAKAKELGAKNTHFANPNGLYDDKHYTTAHDLALIAAYAMHNMTFREIVSTQKKTISWEGSEYDRVVNNKNKLLRQYEGGIGIKTGYTKSAGKCFVGAAERDGLCLITVALGASDTFADSIAMLDYGFENYKAYTLADTEDTLEITVEKSRTKSVQAAASRKISLPLSADEYKMIKVSRTYLSRLTAPVEAGMKIGELTVTLNGETIESCDIITLSPATDDTFKSKFSNLLEDWLFHNTKDKG